MEGCQYSLSSGSPLCTETLCFLTRGDAHKQPEKYSVSLH